MQFADLDAVTVDAYGTLVVLADPVPALREGLRALGVERDAEAVAHAFAKESAYYTERSFEGRDEESLFRLRRDCAAIILDELAAEDLEPEAFVERFVAALRFELLPGAAGALVALRRRGLALAVVSNWDYGLTERLQGLGLGDVAVVTSAEAGAPKPEPAAFLRALEVLAVRPERTLHVGDSEADEAGARAAGMHFAPAPLAAAVEALV
jgi:HAD superfamily hydrolase (TIGR01509 family)